MGIVDVKQTGEHELTLEWESSASNDMVADSTLALITGIDKSPASAKREYVSFESPLHSCRSSARSSSRFKFMFTQLVWRSEILTFDIAMTRITRMLITDDPLTIVFYPFHLSVSVTSNAHGHVHKHVHPHADSESDLERVQRLAMFLESHFGEVHMSVPESEKGQEEGQDEETPEPVLLIRLDEADALVHLRSMVSNCFSAYFTFLLSLPCPFTLLPRSWG